MWTVIVKGRQWPGGLSWWMAKHIYFYVKLCRIQYQGILSDVPWKSAANIGSKTRQQSTIFSWKRSYWKEQLLFSMSICIASTVTTCCAGHDLANAYEIHSHCLLIVSHDFSLLSIAAATVTTHLAVVPMLMLSPLLLLGWLLVDIISPVKVSHWLLLPHVASKLEAIEALLLHLSHL